MNGKFTIKALDSGCYAWGFNSTEFNIRFTYPTQFESYEQSLISIENFKQHTENKSIILNYRALKKQDQFRFMLINHDEKILWLSEIFDTHTERDLAIEKLRHEIVLGLIEVIETNAQEPKSRIRRNPNFTGRIEDDILNEIVIRKSFFVISHEPAGWVINLYGKEGELLLDTLFALPIFHHTTTYIMNLKRRCRINYNEVLEEGYDNNDDSYFIFCLRYINNVLLISEPCEKENELYDLKKRIANAINNAYIIMEDGSPVFLG